MPVLIIIILLAAAAIATFVLYYASNYHKKRANILERVPVSAAGEIDEEGVARVVGKVAALDRTLSSPMTRTRCVYYRILIEEQRAKEDVKSNFVRRRGVEEDEDDDVDWEAVVDEVKSVAFAVEDDSGMATVEGAHLDVDIKSRKRIDTGYLKSVSDAQERYLKESYPEKKFSFSKKMRYTEVTIEEGDRIAVTGEVDLPKDDHPRFRALKSEPLHVSDQTENRAAAESRARAKLNLVLTGISGACTLGLVVWLIVALVSPKKSASSSSGSETVSNTPSNNNTNTRVVQNNNNPAERPPERNPGSAFKEPPQVNLPMGNDLDSVLTRAKARVAANDVFGFKNELQQLRLLFEPNHPRRSDVFKAMAAFIVVENVFIRGDARNEALFWAGKKEVPELCKMLKDEHEGHTQSGYFNKLKELKDPRCAETVAIYLKDNGKRHEAEETLKALDSSAEKIVLPYTKEGYDRDTRTAAIRVLEEIGGKESAVALDKLIADSERDVAAHAKRALDKVAKRAKYVRSVENIFAAVNTHIAANDQFGAHEALKELGPVYKENHPQRKEVFAALLLIVDTKDVSLRNEALNELCRWSATDNVPKLCQILTTIKDNGAESILLKKLKVLKDPRSAEPVAAFLTNFGKQAEAIGVLKEIGAPAEKALHPYTKEINPDGTPANFITRRPVVELLGEIGTKESIPLLQKLCMDRDNFVRQSALVALQKVKSR